MKQLTVIALFSVIVLSMNGQSSGFNMKATQKSVVKINDSLYMAALEVTNDQYRSFLNDLKQNQQTKKFNVAQIDSVQWRNQSAYNEPFVKYYHTHPAYGVYPVVNVSYEAAMLYCEWLTEHYNANDKRKFQKVKFRLPTEQEWIAAAKGGNPSAIYPWKGSELRNKKGLYLCNFVRAADDKMGTAGYDNDAAETTAPSKCYFPNNFGLYNMSGNVAEMIAEKGKTMGGSWMDQAEAMKIGTSGKFTSYNSAQPTIGFRYIMEVIEK